MRVTFQGVTHAGQRDDQIMVTDCGHRFVLPRCNKYAGTFWSSNTGTTILVDYDTPIDCMTCLVAEARGG